MTERVSDSRPATALRGEDHDRALHDTRATVVSIERPSWTVLRIKARLEASMEDPNWSVPNVAFRLHLNDEGVDLSRIYTVRDTDGAGHFRFDVVVHEGSSPMMRWCAALRIGETFGLTGPRPHMGIPDAPGGKVALFVDETGIPALYALMQRWPQGVTGTGWIVARDQAIVSELPQVEGLTLHRIEADDAAQPLFERAALLESAGTYVVWAAGERREMRVIRQHFMALGVIREHLAITGYWGRGFSNTQIDERRKADYENVLAQGGSLADYDDLAVEI
jgi:NADPH-dependent ferric siderophore reductase